MSLSLEPILFHVTRFCSISTLRTLSRTPLWLVIREFINASWWDTRIRGVQLDSWLAIHTEMDPFLVLSRCTTVIPHVVRRLLTLGYNPTPHGQLLLSLAVRTGCVETVRLLLSDGRVDPSSLLSLAIWRDDEEIVQMLLEDERIDPNRGALSFISSGDRKRSVRLIVQDERVHITEGMLESVVMFNTNTEFISLVLSRFDLTQQLVDRMFRIADNEESLPAMTALLDTGLVSSQVAEKAFRAACENSTDVEYMRLFSSHPNAPISSETLIEGCVVLRDRIRTHHIRPDKKLLAILETITTSAMQGVDGFEWLSYPPLCRPIAMMLELCHPTWDDCQYHVTERMDNEMRRLIVPIEEATSERVQSWTPDMTVLCWFHSGQSKSALEEALAELRQKGADEAGLELCERLLALFAKNHRRRTA